MRLAVFTTFAASRKEPLADAVGRVHAAFLAAGLGEPSVRFSLFDPPATAEGSAIAALTGIERISSVDRVLKRWPELARFARDVSAAANRRAAARAISNVDESGVVVPVEFAVVQEISRGVPRSFPFHAIRFLFSAPGFSSGPEFPAAPDRQTLSMLMRAGVDIGAGHPTSPGVSINDSWWVDGRQRSIAAMRVVDADPAAKKLPAPPAAVAAVLTACGKPRKTVQVPIGVAPPRAAAPDARMADVGRAIRDVVGDYRARVPERLETLPHDIPHQPEEATAPVASGPKKPELVRVFAPLGYDCHGETGTFTLRRRTPANLTVKLTLDVGTWSNSLTAFMQVQGLLDGQGFKATLSLPASRRAVRGLVHGMELPAQFPIGGPDRWRRIVENLGALVAELDRSFVPAIEAITGPSPEWFQADSK